MRNDLQQLNGVYLPFSKNFSFMLKNHISVQSIIFDRWIRSHWILNYYRLGFFSVIWTNSFINSLYTSDVMNIIHLAVSTKLRAPSNINNQTWNPLTKTSSHEVNLKEICFLFVYGHYYKREPRRKITLVSTNVSRDQLKLRFTSISIVWCLTKRLWYK